MARVNFDLGIADIDKHLSRTRQYLIGNILEKNARRNPNATAVVSEDGDELSYGDLESRVNQLANGLLDVGVDYGDKVAIVSENRPEYVELIYACAKIGAVCATMNWRQAEREMRHCLNIIEANALVISGQQFENHEWILDQEGQTDLIVTLDNTTIGQSYESVIKAGNINQPLPSTPPTPEDGLLIVYTSGTTGLPKGAILSHRALLVRGLIWRVLAEMGPSATVWKPMFHMMGTEPLVAVGQEGGTLYIIDGFKPGLILDRYTRSRQGYLPLSLGSVDRLLHVYENKGYKPSDFEGAETIGSMADLYPPEKIKTITESFNARFLNTYGATEMGCAPLSGNVIPIGIEPTEQDIYKTEGLMIDLKLVDNNLEKVSQGSSGELAVRGPTLFSGYIGNETANHQSFDDGWFLTGDMFEWLANGQYHYIDRKKYLIKSGGENIYPAAIERALLEHEDIIDVCVTKTSDDRWGEVPKAYVSTKEDTDPCKSALLEFLRGRIASYKLPHYIEFVNREEFPRSTTGKIVRSNVEEWSVSERIRNP